jgi:hypothetical protein
MDSPLNMQVINVRTTELSPHEETEFIHTTVKNTIYRLAHQIEVWEGSGYGWGEDWSEQHEQARVFLRRFCTSRKYQYLCEIEEDLKQLAWLARGTKIVDATFFVSSNEREFVNRDRSCTRNFVGPLNGDTFFTTFLVRLSLHNARDEAFFYVFIKGRKKNVDFGCNSDGEFDFPTMRGS